MTTENDDCVLYPTFLIKGQNRDPNDISSRLGVTPTRTWRLGDQVGDSLLRRDCDAWLYSLPPMATFEIEEAVTSLLDVLQESASAIRAAVEDLGLSATFFVAAYCRKNHTPAVAIEYPTLQRLVGFSAGVDVDLYMLPAREESS